ncbi:MULTISPECIES: HpcH/HpaI aldolase/citrate lyase family protein [Rhizobium/Agrobacterium group]|uniref:HpcH/HpaI aldolase/citrate lyase family protein n=1 Tax=Neorhizobium petrolearium TaxID=515361 RepID=A0ABY8M459_9HYPH|nr:MULTISPECIES: HpcH/HpaI aldolase/citrate lyase family protein [Rhizobium/Agrobacterium group]KGD85747.1 2-keto-3-deoxy-L-rhamnonate aldolase [Rhizobium sp. YS-1r]MCC2609117.1 HpcH/HpaI aldolase/citrate lyase family protein [Neorhizobium petrolearium]WGI69348.1 HpcH/HpaI aldolase/citrate lyase family protein [Neorhizobium petrolearium]
MPAPRNHFKAALKAGRQQIGLWLNMGEALTAEIAGTAGFDWLVIDGEHGPNDLRSIMAQLQALSASPSEVVVRPPMGETWFIKQLLDIGARTLLVPMVDSAREAEELVRAVRYPPRGVRGVGAAVARASGFNAIPDYAETAADEICLIVQAETMAAIRDLENIAAVDGVDGIFIGPADLSADMGYLGRMEAPEVQEVIDKAIVTIVKAGKAAGILTFSESLNRHYLDLGASFVAVGADVTEFSGALKALAARYGRAAGKPAPRPGY